VKVDVGHVIQPEKGKRRESRVPRTTHEKYSTEENKDYASKEGKKGAF